LCHHYQRDEVIKFADFRGDSLKLSFQAWETYSRYIVFCGVHFMAESADILRREHQIVMLPDLNAGCSLADMADIGQVEACWSDLASVVNPSNVVPVSYMNTTAAIKAFTGEHRGSICTSSNAAEVLEWAFETGEKVLFLPDEHLGRNTGYGMGIPLDEMIVWDPAGSEWAVGTEVHLVNRLRKAFQDRRVISLDPSVCVCTTMFRITPQHLLWALENLGSGNVVNRISVDERTRYYARLALD